MDIFNPRNDWKVQIPQKKMYLMKDHSWAFAAWEYERIEGTIGSDSVLLHVDAHLDDVADGLEVSGMMEAKNKEELFSLIRTNEELYSGRLNKTKIQIDNFIWPSFARGTIGSMFVVARQDQHDFASWMLEETKNNYTRNDLEKEKEAILDFIPLEKFQSVYRSFSFEEFKEKYFHEFQKYSNDKSKILNLDLDFFNLSDSLDNPQLMSDKEIRKLLNELLKLCEWDLITVAISPLYCGGKEIAKHLLNLFIEVADLPTLEVEWK
ncbi:UPF0489 family protein [Exiguobacterium profundum]|uniref:UPF0489 family protein n=1 Tax=Exiguobacterium profundum TaxID=307643 RepID=UPI0033943246